MLLEAAAQGPASVVLAIRSDFFDPLMHSPFAPVLKDPLVQLGRIADLRPSIERPAALVGLRFAPGLVGRIVEEVGPEESNLPLLQHALECTWQRRAGALLSNDAYVAAGVVAQAINQAARDCYEWLSPGERDAARRVFLRLVRPGDGTAPIRIRAAVPEDAEERHGMEAFAHPARRLLFVGEEAGVPVVEVAHEALVRGWDTLRGWMETSREKLRVRDAINDWRTPAAINELIPAGSTLLQRARELLGDPGDVRLDQAAREYVRRSIAAAKAQQWQRVTFYVLAPACVTALALFVWWAAVGLLDRQTEAAIYADAQGLSERWAEAGPSALALAIEDRLAGNVDDNAIYLLVDPTMRRVAGNLVLWPATVREPNVWYELQIRVAGATSLARVQPYDLSSGYHLLIGRDVQVRAHLRNLLTDALLWAVLVVSLPAASAWWWRRSRQSAGGAEQLQSNYRGAPGPRQPPVTPAGNAVPGKRMSRSAKFWWRRAICHRR